MKRIIEFLKRLVGFVSFYRFEAAVIALMAVCGAGWAVMATNALKPIPAYIVGNAGWLLGMVFAAWILRMRSAHNLQLIRSKLETIEECNDQLRRASAALDRAYGYDDKLDRSVAIYSKLVKGVGTPTANALVNFALTTDPSDTVFLIRINHAVESWHFQVAGKPMHVDQARAIMIAVLARIETMAGPDSLIQKKDLIQN